ncbi:MAG: methyltransferase domain-containing protein [Pseudomonadota bacterium]
MATAKHRQAIAPNGSSPICRAMDDSLTNRRAKPVQGLRRNAGAPEIFDAHRQAALRLRAFRRHRGSDGADFLLQRAAEDLADRVALVSRRFDRVLEFFGHTGVTAERLSGLSNVRSVERLETLPGSDIEVSPDDLDPLPLAQGHYNLIVAPLCLHMFNDLPGVLVQLRRALAPDGLLLANLPAAGTLGELRDSLLTSETNVRGGAAMRINPFAELQELTGLLQRTGYTLPVGDVEELVVRHNSPLNLMRDLRAMGQTSAAPSKAPSLNRSILAAVEADYGMRYADPDGRLRASFNLVSLSGWSPHESQQKPLAPGSAKTSLTEVLGKR